MGRIRIATWNLWWRFGPWEQRQELIARELADVDADVVCLQEVWAEVGARPNPAAEDVALDGPAVGGPSQTGRLAERLGLPDHRFAWRFAHEGVAFGNAVLSRWPIADTDAIPLPALGRYEEHRTALRVTVETPQGVLPVATTHLNFRWDQSHVRQAQVQAICRWLGAFPREALPIVLTGDLNADPNSDEIRTLTGRRAVPVEGLGFFDAWEVAGEGDGATWSRANGHAAAGSAEPDRRIDFVLAGYPSEERRGAVIAARRCGLTAIEGVHPSDHFGVVAEIEA